MAEGNKLIVPLASPIEHGGEELHSLELTEPDLGGLMRLDEATGDVGLVLLTIQACSGLPPSVVRQIKARDLKALSEACAKLMGEESQATGARRQRSSPIASIGRRAS